MEQRKSLALVDVMRRSREVLHGEGRHRRVGEFLGPYRLVRRIARGGMAPSTKRATRCSHDPSRSSWKRRESGDARIEGEAGAVNHCCSLTTVTPEVTQRAHCSTLWVRSYLSRNSSGALGRLRALTTIAASPRDPSWFSQVVVWTGRCRAVAGWNGSAKRRSFSLSAYMVGCSDGASGAGGSSGASGAAGASNGGSGGSMDAGTDAILDAGPAPACPNGEVPPFAFEPPPNIGPLFDGWPVRTVDQQQVNDILASWKLRVDGMVDTPFELSFYEMLCLARRDQIVDFHCVEGWSIYDVPWNGMHPVHPAGSCWSDLRRDAHHLPHDRRQVQRVAAHRGRAGAQDSACVRV